VVEAALTLQVLTSLGQQLCAVRTKSACAAKVRDRTRCPKKRYVIRLQLVRKVLVLVAAEPKESAVRGGGTCIDSPIGSCLNPTNPTMLSRTDCDVESRMSIRGSYETALERISGVA
jgi:hypothetical protein